MVEYCADVILPNYDSALARIRGWGRSRLSGRLYIINGDLVEDHRIESEWIILFTVSAYHSRWLCGCSDHKGGYRCCALSHVTFTWTISVHESNITTPFLPPVSSQRALEDAAGP